MVANIDLARRMISAKIAKKIEAPYCAPEDIGVFIRSPSSRVPPLVVESIAEGYESFIEEGYITNCNKKNPKWKDFRHLIVIIWSKKNGEILCEAQYHRYSRSKQKFSHGDKIVGISARILRTSTEACI
jgi:hypothetical protein